MFNVGRWLVRLATLGAVASACSDPADPEIRSFTADAAEVAFGESATLRWEVASAARIALSADGVALAVDPTALTGVLVTAPLEQGTNFTLTAFGDDTSVSRTVSVTVAIGPEPTVAAFVAEPSRVAAGETVALRWQARFTNQVRIVEGESVVLADGAPSGVTMVFPTTSSTYRLTATGERGRTATATVSVAVRGALAVERFEASPETVDLGNPVRLRWRALNADRVVIDDGTQAIVDTTEADGEVSVLPEGATTYRLMAAQGEVRREASAAVAVRVPQAFFAAPGARTVYRGETVQGGFSRRYAVETSTAIYLRAQTWSDADAESCTVDTVVELRASDGVLIGSDDNDGRGDCSLLDPGFDEFTRLEAGRYELQVRAGGITVEQPVAYDLVVQAVPVEACCVGEVALSSADGRFFEYDRRLRLGEVRDYVITTTKAIGFIAATFSGRQDVLDCFVETTMRLFDPQGDVLGVSDRDFGGCSAFSAAFDRFAVLEPGRYPLTVEEAGRDQPILFSIIFVPIEVDECGNGIVEPERGETCDDGNNVSGDGCDRDCQAEVDDAFVAAPGASMTFTGLSLQAFETAVVRIDVPEPVVLTAETFSRASTGACFSGSDTKIELYDVFRILQAEDDDGGVGVCSRIDSSDPGALLAPGTYFLWVEGFNSGRVIGYELVLTASSPQEGP